MTDNEIVKAMICCTNFPVCDRDNCPYGESTNCATMLGKDVVDLINSQKAEISVLRKLLDKAETEMNNQSENIKKLTADYSSMQSTLAKMSMGVEEAKAEAIKKCLDKVAVFCAESGLFQCEADEMLLFNYLDSLKMEAMLKANGMVGDAE